MNRHLWYPILYFPAVSDAHSHNFLCFRLITGAGTSIRYNTYLIDIIDCIMNSQQYNRSSCEWRRRQRFHRFARVSLFLNIIILVVTISDNEVQAFQSPISQRYTSTTINDIMYPRQRQSTILMANSNNNDLLPTSLQTIRTASTSSIDDISLSSQPLQFQVQLETLSRIIVPSALASLGAFFIFPPLSLGLSYLINDSATFAVLSVDSSQFIQNFLTVTGLTFSILVGQTYYFMYQQQEAVFVSLFGEVTEAKSLLEQVALVCQGRRDMYEMCLVAVKR